MTTEEIIEELRPEKPISRATVYLYMKKLGIKPKGALRQCPQVYPDNAGQIIRSALGLPEKKSRRR